METKEFTVEDLDNFIIQNYKKMPAKKIAEKFGVKVQVVGGALNRLDNLAEINKDKSFNKVKKTTLSALKKKERQYTNHDGENKAIVRKYIAELIAKTGGYSPKILSLPADKCIWELDILTAKPTCLFYAVEKHQDTFFDMVKTVESNPLLRNSFRSMQNESMNTVINRSLEDDYAHAILDYCGTINTCYDDLQTAFNKNIVSRGGLIVVTMSKMILTHTERDHTRKFLDAMPFAVLGNGKHCESTYATIGLINGLLSECNYRYVVEDFKEYKDTSPMMVFVIRRVK